MKPKTPEGAKVWVVHIRTFSTEEYGITFSSVREAREKGITDPPLGKGGMTMVTITLPDGKNLYGVAHCHEKDNFNKARGRMIATGRALKHFQEAT